MKIKPSQSVEVRISKIKTILAAIVYELYVHGGITDKRSAEQLNEEINNI